MPGKRKRWVLVLAGTIICGLLLSARPSDFSSSKQHQALQLFEQSYDLSRQLEVYPRTYALLTLLKNSRGLVTNARYEQWCDEMFHLSFGIQDGWDRVAQEKNAVVRLSEVNPIRAMELFKQIDRPLPQADGTFPEDVRADSAAIIFLKYWNSQKDPAAQLALLPTIEEQLKQTGNTGEFPYAAAGEIIESLASNPSAQSTDASNRIFSEALTFYRQTPYKFTNRNEQFYELLKSGEKALPDRNLFSQAVGVFVGTLLNSPKDMDYQAEAETPKGITKFTDNRTEFLFQAFPLIQDAAPKLAAKLTRQYPELNKADRSMSLLSGGYVLPGYDPTETELIHSKILQISIVQRIAQLQGSNLDRAKMLAGRLTDDELQIEGYAALLPGILKSNPEEARQLYFGHRTRLQELTDPDEHLRGLVTLAKASYQLNLQDSSFSDYVSAALEEGGVSFSQDSRVQPQWPPSGRRGFKEVSDMVSYAGARGVDSLATKIQNMDNLELKAHLLSIEAKALATSAGQ